MSEELLCPNLRYNTAISQYLALLSPADAEQFRERFRQQRDAVLRNGSRHTDVQHFQHTLNELLAGAFALRQGFEAGYEPSLDQLTPDWLFTGRDSGQSIIAEVVNIHIDEKTGNEQREALSGSYLWAGHIPDNGKRLYDAVRRKAVRYKELAEQRGIPFVVFLYSFFEAFVAQVEVDACLHDPDWGLFRSYPHLSGVCHFEGVVNGYQFTYSTNPHTTHRDVGLCSGFLPFPLAVTATGGTA
jgi:hypothetical protein